MPTNIEGTLREIDAWYNELPGGTDRPKMLSKLALLELCGWLETHIDEIVLRIADKSGLDADWITKNVIESTHGFTYVNHIRPMLEAMIGERGVKKCETALEAESAGALDQLKAELGSLWVVRGHLAHVNLAGPVKQQVQVNAPSWTINRQRILAKMFGVLETQFTNAL